MTAYLNLNSLAVDADIHSVLLADDLTSDVVALDGSRSSARFLNNHLLVAIESALYIVNLNLHLLVGEGSARCETDLDLVAANNSLELLQY